MSNLLHGVLVFYPKVTKNTTLKITLTTTDHEFVFTGKPTQDFEAGKRITFPITVDKNFTRGGSQLAYTSTVRTDVDQFYYYGGTNCLLIPTANTLGYLDVTQYVTDSRWHNTKNTVDIITQKPAVYAKIIWSEGSDVIANDMVDGTNDYKLKMVGSAVGSADAISTDSNGKSTLTIKRGSAAGNALVGIYDSSDNLLWSYHIWCPEDDPTSGMYEYTRTNSGYYTVMTMPIGAIKKAYPGMPNPVQAQGYFYQWGRKDPQGKFTNMDSNVGDGILAVLGPDQSTALNIGDSDYGITGGNLHNCRIWLARDDGTEAHNRLKNAHEAPGQTKSLGRFMIDYSVSKPWMYICCDSDSYNVSDWTATDNWLWGNGFSPDEYNFMDKTYKSIFDPSPEGFRVAPRDLYVGYSRTFRGIQSKSQSAEDMEQFVATDINVDVSTTSSYSQANNANGYAFHYQAWKSGPSDFILSTGQRVKNGDMGNSNSAAVYWTSAPGPTNGKASMLYIVPHACVVTHQDQRCRAYAVRCVKEQ
jgi:hypothetical protein